MARPTVACGLLRLHVYAPDTTTSRGYLSGLNATFSMSKDWSACALSFSANALEAALVADETILDDAFAVIELNTGSWTAVGTPFLLAPGEGTVIASTEGSAREHSPVAVSALKGLLDGLIVLPNECDTTSPTLRYACGIEGNRYFGWMSKGFTEGDGGETWHDADEYDPTGHPKRKAPILKLDPSVKFVWRNAAEGGLTLFRIGTFTVSARRKVCIRASADEEFKVYLDGPNMGGVVIDSSSDEDGWRSIQKWGRKLEPGTYRVSAEMTTVDSVGGDGNDSLALTCFTIDSEGNPATFLLRTSSSTRVHRQAKSDLRPGMKLGEVMRRALEDNSDLGVTGADILLDGRTFTDSVDSSTAAWEDGQEWVWPLGTPLSSAFADFTPVADLWLNTSFGFEAWNDRGTDLSATVKLTPGATTPSAGMNIVEYGYQSDPAGGTRMWTESQDGFDVVVGTTAEAAAARPRWGSGDMGSAVSIGRAKANAAASIAQSATARRYYQGRIAAVTGAVPLVNFTVCDVVDGRNYRNVATDLEALVISGQQPGPTDPQTVQFTIEASEA